MAVAVQVSSAKISSFFFVCFLFSHFLCRYLFLSFVCLFVSLDITIDTSSSQSSPTESAQSSASTSYSTNQTPVTSEKLLPSDPSTYSTRIHSTTATKPATPAMSTIKSPTVSQSTATTSSSTNADLATTTTEPLSGVFVLIKYCVFSFHVIYIFFFLMTLVYVKQNGV